VAVPPCRTYKHFLTRFAAIESRFPDLRPIAEAPSPDSGSAPEGDEELTDLAFLYLSRDFLAAVAAPATVNSIQITNAYVAVRKHSLFSRLWCRLRGKGSAITPSGLRPECETGARRLASRVVLTEFFALLGTALTLTISAYALAGHLILDSQQQILDDFAAIQHDTEELAKDLPDASPLISPTILTSLCDPAAGRPQMKMAMMRYKVAADPQGGTSPATAPRSKLMPLRIRAVGDVFLGCITLYLLPTLYGGLGAGAATLRALRRKVDQSLVTMTDRGRVQQDVILGVLCGTIIGLFFSYLGASNPQQGLGLSALALLAGYNISGVFAFLDELSSRMFQPAAARDASNRPG
jgi:hypothetical protein